ncbi:hypothetical protein D3C81_1114690 [compost metagenome]
MELYLELDCRPYCPTYQLLHFADQGVHIGMNRHQRLPARERQESMGQGCCPLCGALCHHQVTLHVSNAPLLQAELDQFKASRDAREQIVEVVSDTPGQLADRFHLLRLS